MGSRHEDLRGQWGDRIVMYCDFIRQMYWGRGELPFEELTSLTSGNTRSYRTTGPLSFMSNDSTGFLTWNVT